MHIKPKHKCLCLKCQRFFLWSGSISYVSMKENGGVKEREVKCSISILCFDIDGEF